MYLVFDKTSKKVLDKELKFNSFSLQYNLEEDIFFENKIFYLFLKTNYSEKYTEKVLSIKDELNEKIITKHFEKDGFWVIIDKKTENITIHRDKSGLCVGYYHLTSTTINIATNVHQIASNVYTELNKNAIFQLLYFDYLWDGQSIYKNIKQLKLGANLKIDADLSVISSNFEQPNIIERENQLSEKENSKQLRREIVKAHENYVNDNNIVFLSGGIDSVAMLIALDDITPKNTIQNHSFKVKGTLQDETEYAKSIANHLNVNLQIIERDITNEITEKSFKEQLLKMNNPYSGMWIFGNQIKNTKNTTYFAGQDTRLHTPSLNTLDSLAFTIFMLSKKGLKPVFFIFDMLLFPIKKIFNLLLKKKPITSKIFLGLRRALYLFNTDAYIKLVYFKADKQIIASFGLPLQELDTIIKKYDFTTKGIKNKRSLYNKIVSKKWIEQYVNDMRYMIDMVNSQGGKLAMPFYDMDLAQFSATIPFDLSIKTMKGKSQFSDKTSLVHKFVLRDALIDKIDEKTYLRSKAVSRTGHLIFNQGLDKVLKIIIVNDINSSNSLVKEYDLIRFTNCFLNKKNEWIMNDDKYLLKIYYLASIIIYNNELN